MMKESEILYETGDFWVCKSRTHKGYDVFESGVTHSKRVAQVSGENALRKASAEADRRHCVKLYKELNG